MKKETLFDFEIGRVLSQKYEIDALLGQGWEGEVYRVKELETGIFRAAKFFYPHRNLKNKTLKFQVKQMHKMRQCKVLVQYNTIEKMRFRNEDIHYLVSDFVEGSLLSDFIRSRKGGRLDRFEALHLLYALAEGMSAIHYINEYHGDLHSSNIIISKYGLKYHYKVFDFFHWKDTKRENIFEDVVSLIHIFYEALGGKKHYAKQSREVKEIICGLKRSLIRKKFKNALHIVVHLKNLRLE